MRRLVGAYLKNWDAFFLDIVHSEFITELFSFASQNFVGLSVNDGYITCGSETNEVRLTSNSYLMLLA